MRKVISNSFEKYGLTYVLVACFLVSLLLQAVFQFFEVRADAQTHHQVFHFTEFLISFGSAVFENWQSEFLQVAAFVYLSKKFIHVGSPQSKDGDEEMMERIKSIEAKLDSPE